MKSKKEALALLGTGYKTSICTICWEVFSTLANFGKHQKTAYGTSTPVTCVDPASVGLVNKQGIWKLPGKEEADGS